VKILVVAAHPDDEILGLGGTLARHIRSGDVVETLILATGATSRVADDYDTVAALREAANAAANVLGCTPPRFGNLPDNRLDSLDLIDVIKMVEFVVAEVKPEVVYTHWAHDLNVDHGITCRAVLTACRPLPGSATRAIYAFETVSSSEWNFLGEARAFAPNRFVDVADTLETKICALKCYAHEMRDFPHARSYEAIRALAKVRGAQSGLTAAEAFVVLREIEGLPR